MSLQVAENAQQIRRRDKRAWKEMNKREAGRPPVVDIDVEAKLEEAFIRGCTDAEACLYAGISRTALYNHQKRYPEWVERKELLKEQAALRSRFNVYDAIESGDRDMSKWYLERKKKDEFSTKTESSVNIDASLDDLHAKKEALREFMEAFVSE